MQELSEGRATNKQTDPGDGTVEPDLMLIGSVKGKLEWASRVAAKDLYVSALWRSRRKYAEQSGVPWYILSAKYGLVNPETRIAWYDVSLSDLPAAGRRAWSQRIVDTLTARYAAVERMVIEIHAGMDYVDFGLASGLAGAGMVVHRPLLGIPIGRHLAWYREHGAEG
jgi:hypothetical protein